MGVGTVGLYSCIFILFRGTIKETTATTGTHSAKAFDNSSYIEEGDSTTPASGKPRYGTLRFYQATCYKYQ